MNEPKRQLHDPNTDETLPLGVSVELVMPRAPKTRAPSAMRTTSIVAPPSLAPPPRPIIEAAQKLTRELSDANVDVALGRSGRERSFGIDAALAARDTAVRELAILLGPRDPDAIRLREAYNQLDARVRAQAEHRRDTRAPPQPNATPTPPEAPPPRAPTPTVTATRARATASTSAPRPRSAVERVVLGVTLVAACASIAGLLLARRAELRPRPRPVFSAEPLRCVGASVVDAALECTLDAATLSALSPDDRRARLESTLAREGAARDTQVLVVRDVRDGRLLAVVAGPAGHAPTIPLEPPASKR